MQVDARHKVRKAHGLVDKVIRPGDQKLFRNFKVLFYGQDKHRQGRGQNFNFAQHVQAVLQGM